MKNIRTFIFSSSLILTAWLGASYMTELTVSQDRSQAADTSVQLIPGGEVSVENNGSVNVSEEVSYEVAMPVVQLD